MFVHAQVLDASIAEALGSDLERSSARGTFPDRRAHDEARVGTPTRKQMAVRL
jgi:hypothetical protein